jgi:hypothetical protein
MVRARCHWLLLSNRVVKWTYVSNEVESARLGEFPNSPRALEGRRAATTAEYLTYFTVSRGSNTRSRPRPYMTLSY